MSCALEADLTAYMDGELGTARRGEVETHLVTCHDCQATLTLLRGTMARVMALPDWEPSPQVRRVVLERIAQAKQTGWLPWSRAFLFPALGAAGAAAMVAVLITHQAGQTTMTELEDAGGLELAANYEVVRDLDVWGIDHPEDVDVVAQLDELEEGP